MSFRLVTKSVTLNDLERRNRPNGCVISPNSATSDFGAVYKCYDLLTGPCRVLFKLCDSSELKFIYQLKINIDVGANADERRTVEEYDAPRALCNSFTTGTAFGK